MHKRSWISFCFRITAVIVLSLSVLLPQSARAVAEIRPLQQSDATMQCAQSLLLLFQGDLNEAKPQLESAVTALQQVEEPDSGVGMCALFLAIVHHSTQDWVETLTAYNIALDVFREQGDDQMTWAALFGISSVYGVQGRFNEAYAVLEEALPLTGLSFATNTPPCENNTTSRHSEWLSAGLLSLAQGATLNNFGVIIASGESQQQTVGYGYADARTCFQAALDRFASLSSQSANPDAMLNDMLSGIMLDLAFGGQPDEDMFGEIFTSLLISSMVPQLAEAFTPVLLSNLGQVYALDEEYALAERYLTDALAQVRAGQEQSDAAELELILPLLTGFFGDLGAAVDPSTAALLEGLPDLIRAGQRLNAIGSYNSEALVLNNLGFVYMAQEQNELAQSNLEEALTIYEDKLAGYPGAINVHANLGWLAQQADDDATALRHYEAAIGHLAAVRSVAEGDVAQLRQGNAQMLDAIGLQGILSQQADLYALAANLYLQQEQPVEAFQAIEQGRARLFRDMVSTGNARLPATEAKLLDDLREAFDLQVQAEISLTQLRAVRPIDNAQIRQWEGELASAEAQMAALMAEVEANYRHLLVFAPGVDQQVNLTALQTQILDDETTLVVYYIAEGLLEEPTEQLAVAWVIDADNITAIPLDTTGREIRTQITAVRDSIATQDFYFAAADALRQTLITPLLPYIEHDNLVIAPYGSLYYLPFAALWDATTERYLIEDYTITYAPSVGTLPLIQGNRNPNGGDALVMGIPDGEPPLPAVTGEVQAVATIFDTEPLLSQAATESTLRTSVTAVDIVHLAAHGNYSATVPLRSAVELAGDDANDGILEVREVFGLDLAEANLVFLSACKTALGEQGLGDEITGLTRAFLYAGTPSIITTLWSVNDNASGALVSEFYGALETQPSFAAALQAAQLAAMRTGKWADPYYWAAFTLHGDYLGSGERSAVPVNALLPVATPTPIQATSTATTTVQPTPPPPPEVQLEILVDNLNVRSGPGTAYERIGQLTAGNRVTIIGSNIDETWWEICCVDGQRGWVINNVNYMRIVESTQ